MFSLVQRLDPTLNFGQLRKALRSLTGIAPTFVAAIRPHPSAGAVLPPSLRWQAQRHLRRGSLTWRYLTENRKIPTGVLASATALDNVREGSYGSAWFAHRDHDGRLTGIEMRGPRFRGFTAESTKTLFRLPGSREVITRLVVCEAPIDALSVAALERICSDTLYVATGGGIGPGTITALEKSLSELATRRNARLAIATDGDKAGERYAIQLSDMVGKLRVPVERVLPPDGLNDWNDALKVQAGRGVR